MNKKQSEEIEKLAYTTAGVESMYDPDSDEKEWVHISKVIKLLEEQKRSFVKDLEDYQESLNNPQHQYYPHPRRLLTSILSKYKPN